MEIVDQASKSYLLLSPRFHGTTIIGRMLSAGGMTSYYGDGEVNNEIDNQFCGCGLSVKKCKLWNKIEILEHEFSYQKFSIFNNKFIIFFFHILNIENILLNFKSYKNMVNNESRQFLNITKIENKKFNIDGTKSLKRAFILNKDYCNINGFIHIKRDIKQYLISCYSSGYSIFKMPQRYLEVLLYRAICSFLYNKIPGIEINYDNFVDDPENVINEGRKFIGLKCMSVEDISSYLKIEAHFLGNVSAYQFTHVYKKNKNFFDKIKRKSNS